MIISFTNTIKLNDFNKEIWHRCRKYIIQWILKGSTQPLQNNFKMHELKIFNRIIYHKCVEILLLYYTNLLGLYKHATAYLLPCISCINTVGTVPQSVARHYQHHSSASLSLVLITNIAWVSSVEIKIYTPVQLMILFIPFWVDLQTEILASRDIKTMLCITAMLVKQLATFAADP